MPAPPAVKPPPAEPFPARSTLHCDRTEPGGYRETADVTLNDRVVRSLRWEVDTGRIGSCTFQLDDFRQVDGQDQIELRGIREPACRLLIWRRGPRVTLSAADCDKVCGDAVSERIWPVTFDDRSSQCAG